MLYDDVEKLMRYLLTLLILFVSTFSHAETVTSPFIYELADVNTQHCVSTNPRICSSSPAAACEAAAAKAQSDYRQQFPDRTHVTFGAQQSGSGCNVIQYSEGRYNGGIAYGIVSETLTCTADETLFDFEYTSPPSGSSACSGGCVINKVSSDLARCAGNFNGDGIYYCSFKATKSSQACKLKPFDKDNPPEVNDPPKPPDNDNCPAGKKYSTTFNACVTVQCPSGSTFDDSTKSCKTTNPDDSTDPTDPENPKPDEDKPDDQKCPDTHTYNKPTNECIKKPECTQAEKDANGGQCPTGNEPEPDPTDNSTTCPDGYKYNKDSDRCDREPVKPTDCSQEEKDANGGQCKEQECTQAEKDANGGQCKPPPKPSQCLEYNPDGTCKQREGNITCDTFKPFCEFKDSFDEFTKKFDFSTDGMEDKQSEYDSKIDAELSKISGDHPNRGFIENNIFRTDRVKFNSSCPADKTVNLPLTSYTFSYQPICDLFIKLSNILLAFSYLSALFIFSRFL